MFKVTAALKPVVHDDFRPIPEVINNRRSDMSTRPECTTLLT